MILDKSRQDSCPQNPPSYKLSDLTWQSRGGALFLHYEVSVGESHSWALGEELGGGFLEVGNV